MVAIYAIPTKVFLKIPMVNNEITEVPLKIYKGVLSRKLSFRFSDRIISNSKAGLSVFNAPKIKSNYIHNGFDFNRIQNLEPVDLVKTRYNLNSKIVIGMFANFSKMKDYFSYIDAAIQLSILYENIIFIAVGSGDSKDYEEMVPLDLKDRILFLGQQNNVESIMNCCDIGVLASFTEGISNSVLELMALGKPVVVSGGGGSTELVVNGMSGFLIPSNNSVLLAQKISLLLNDDKERIIMGINAKQRVAKKFSINLMVRKFYFEYKRLCAE
jgi:glycosyltransferase involved in cell wall biosynthesis